ncbi:MAG: 50S ribosomal protein L6 [Nanoarchaeota archaeon]|nr:50S ribosomal protein L6 [Nanoarchaeota archaeon]
MKKEIIESLHIPAEISCVVEGRKLICRKDNVEMTRTLDIPSISLEIKDSKIVLSCKKGSKREFKVMKSFIAHTQNIFTGLNNKFAYKLEACNLHFPMTLKLDKNTLLINNFLGEKIPRTATILPGVDIEIKGSKIDLSSSDREAAGQTAANIEKATRIKYRDRRIFQDGIFITHKPGREEK